MALQKWNRDLTRTADFDPFSTLSLLDSFWPAPFEQEESRSFIPVMDVTETDTAYQLRLEVPGMEKENISIEVENSILTVSGEKKTEEEEKNAKHHRIERRYGSFTRSLRLKDVDTEGISAEHKNGVLCVTVPKSEKAQPRKITIG